MNLEPANPNDLSFLSSVFIGANATAFRKVRSVLDLMGSPHPQDGQFFSGDNADRIMLNDEGLIVSVVYNRSLRRDITRLFGQKTEILTPVFEARKVVSDHIVQPLLQIDLSHNCCLEIVPGIEQIGATKEQVKELAGKLAEEKLKFRKRDLDVAGFIRTPEDQENLLVVSNRRAVVPTRHYNGTVEAHAQMQDMVYGALREEIADAFQTASAAAVDRALQHCRKIVALPKRDKNRILNPSWNDPVVMTPRRAEIMRAGANYQAFRHAA